MSGEIGVVGDLVPRDMERHGRCDAGEAMDLGGVGDLLVRVTRDAALGEHLEARPGVAEGPRRQLDVLLSERRVDARAPRSGDGHGDLLVPKRECVAHASAA